MRWLSNGVRGVYSLVRYSEMKELQAQFENYVTLTTTRLTAVRYSKALTVFFNRFPDKRHPDEFTRADVQDYQVWRLREGINPRTVNYEVGVLRAFWNWMADMERVTWNPMSQVRRLKEKEPKRTALSVPQQLKLHEGCFRYEDKLLLALALSTGLRGQTLALLEKSDVDFDNKRLVIPAEKMKAGRTQENPLPDYVLELLKEAPDGRIFGKYARTASAIRYRWGRICARVGIRSMGIRTARRTFATTLLRSGADIKVVQDLLGHRNILTTSRYLGPADQRTVIEAVNKLPQVINDPRRNG